MVQSRSDDQPQIFIKKKLVCGVVTLVFGLPIYQPLTLAAERVGIEEITVTARKREESLQDVPIAISAFSGDALNKKGVTNIAQVADYTPGLEMDSTAAISGS